MIEAIRLVVTPFHAWSKITTARYGVIRIVLLYLLPLLIAGVALDAYSLVRWGEQRGEFAERVKVPQATAIQYAAAQVGLLLASIILSATATLWVSLSFQIRVTFLQCFTLMSYGFAPILLARFLDFIPAIPSWIAWGIGVLLSTSVLYHGVGLALKPEQTKGFGIYLFSVLFVLLSSGLSHFIARSVFLGH